jgi:glycosyltransferase involved in cell wall biosynthesis
MGDHAPSVRVGLNLLYLLPGRVGGTEIYARRLVGALAAARPDVAYTVLCAREAADSLATEAWPGNVRLLPLAVPAASKPLRAAAELALLPGVAARHRFDVLHSLGTTAPPVTGCARVVTVHDLIYEHFPATFPTAARLGLRVLVPLGARRAHVVLADSAATKRDVIAHLGVDAARVEVAYLGPGMAVAPDPTPAPALRERLGLGADPVVLCVSAALVHKNLERLIDAVAALPGTPRLVLVGHAGREADALRARAAERGLGARVHMTGWIEDADLEGLYGLADVFAYPSLFEGFGLPVLEAMRRGVPVACSDATSLPEVAGDAALLFDPRDTGAITAALAGLLADPARREALRTAGRERAAGFTWAACAAATLAGYEHALATAGR